MIELARRGEEVVITSHGQAVAKLTGIPACAVAAGRPDRPRACNRPAWLAKLAALRGRVATGKSGLTIEHILDEDRGA